METGLRLLTFVGVLSAFVAVDCVRIRRADDKHKITTVQDVPYLTHSSGTFKGFIPDLIKLIAEKIDIKYEFSLAPDGKYGMRQANGQWNGMIGEVTSRRARIAAGAITVTDSRKTAVDFTDSFMSTGNVILFKKPDEGKELPFKNAKELADQTEISYGLVKDGMTQDFFATSQDPTYKKMWDYMGGKPKLLVSGNKAGVEKVRGSDGKFAMIIENTTAAYWVHKEPCDLVIVGEPMNVRKYGLALRKGDALTGQMNTALGELKSEGKIKELQDKWWEKDAKCSAPGLAAHYVTHVLVASLVAFCSALNFL